MLPFQTLFLAGAAALLLAGLAHAQSAHEHQHESAAPVASAAASSTPSELADGEIRKVDKEQKKLTLKHGPIQNLAMPAMTMVFHVSDDAMLDQARVGDKVRFQAEKIDGKMTVTVLRP